MRSVETYREHIRVRSGSTKSLFESAYKAFSGMEELVDTRSNDEQVYDHLQARINAMQARKISPTSIIAYFSYIKQYLHYRGIRLHQTRLVRNSAPSCSCVSPAASSPAVLWCVSGFVASTP